MLLRFVYAVDGGLVATVKDYLHKIIAPGTYPCRLCALTYGNLGEDRSWACFVKNLPIAAEFVHRDEFHAAHPGAAHQLPVLLLDRGGKNEVLASAAEINACTTTDGLIALVKGRVEAAMAA